MSFGLGYILRAKCIQISKIDLLGSVAHLSSGCWYLAAIFFMRSLKANSEGGGGGGVVAAKETSGLVSAAAIPGKGNTPRESVCCRRKLPPPSLCRAILEGRSKAEVSGEDLRSEQLALRFLGGGGVLSPGAVIFGAGGVTTLARFFVDATRSSSNADGPDGKVGLIGRLQFGMSKICG